MGCYSCLLVCHNDSGIQYQGSQAWGRSGAEHPCKSGWLVLYVLQVCPTPPASSTADEPSPHAIQVTPFAWQQRCAMQAMGA